MHEPKRWSVEEIRALRRRYSGEGDAELAEAFGCSVAELEAKAAELALAKDKRKFRGRPMPRWTADELVELRRDYAHTPNVELAKRFGRSLKSVNSKAHGLGLKKSEDHLVSMGRRNVAQREDRRDRET